MKNFAKPLWPWMFGGTTICEEEATHSQILGTLWQGNQASRAFYDKSLRSTHNGVPLRICLRYLLPVEGGHVHSPRPPSLWVAWVDIQGRVHTFRKIPPITKSNISNDLSITTEEDRYPSYIEQTFLGHAFLLVAQESTENHVKEPTVSSLDDLLFVGAYRPERLSTNSAVTPTDLPCHLLEISPRRQPFWKCFCPPMGGSSGSTDFDLRIREAKCLEPLRPTKKEYVEETIHQWPVCVEKDCFDEEPEFGKIFSQDLQYALSRLPRPARRALLQRGTKIFVNRTFWQGPKVQPVLATGLCFHPDKEWLVRHGDLADKAGCVELFNPRHYLKDRELWGRGGVLLHELAHAYHRKCLSDGYENAEVKQCYERAMEEGLYNQVRVHGPQGPVCRGYACQNAMEYFAELSTAFLGCPKRRNEEYNKWYPFNRAQIKEHDPRAYALLCKVWNV